MPLTDESMKLRLEGTVRRPRDVTAHPRLMTTNGHKTFLIHPDLAKNKIVDGRGRFGPAVCFPVLRKLKNANTLRCQLNKYRGAFEFEKGEGTQPRIHSNVSGGRGGDRVYLESSSELGITKVLFTKYPALDRISMEH